MSNRLDIFDVIVFDGMTVGDMVKETHSSISEVDDSVSEYLRTIIEKVKTPQDIMMVSETLSKLLETRSKKSDNLIKLISAISKLTSSKIVGKGDDAVEEEVISFNYSEKDVKKIAEASQYLVDLYKKEKDESRKTNIVVPEDPTTEDLPGDPEISGFVDLSGEEGQE